MRREAPINGGVEVRESGFRAFTLCSLLHACRRVATPFTSPPSSARRRVGDPFTSVDQGPQVYADQFNKIMGYIDR